MNSNKDLINTFYSAFVAQDAEKMMACYHKNILFRDPIFGVLVGHSASDMWRMLLERSKGKLKIEYSNIHANDLSGSAKWVATYTFGKTNRKIVNKIRASFVFKDGLIVSHSDNFDIWKWSRQAFGIKGLLFGWTDSTKQKIRNQALLSLTKYQENKN